MNHLNTVFKKGISIQSLNFITNEKVKKILIRLGQTIKKRFNSEISLGVNSNEHPKLVISIHSVKNSKEEKIQLNEFILRELSSFLETELMNKLIIEIINEES